MKMAAATALSKLTHQDVPDSVLKAYNLETLKFGEEYIIPKPFDPRVLLWVAPAVAEAAMKSGVARRPIDLVAYREQLEARLGRGWTLMRQLINKARHQPKRVVFGEGEDPKIIRAAAIIAEEGFAQPILLGRPELIRQKIADLSLSYAPTIIDPQASPHFEAYCQALFDQRQRKGLTLSRATAIMRRRSYFGPMMVQMGHADAYLSGVNHDYPDIIRPALEVIGIAPDVHKVAGMYIMIVRDKIYFFADTTVNIDPSAEDLAEIAALAAAAVHRFEVEPRIAMLSFSNFGSTRHPPPRKFSRRCKFWPSATPSCRPMAR